MKCVLAICSIALSFDLWSQHDSIWIGDNLTEILCTDKGWYYQAENFGTYISIENGKYYVIEELSSHKYELDFIRLDRDMDTIILRKGRTYHLFIKPSLHHTSSFTFQSFEYAEIDQWGQPTVSYNLNRYGLFRKSNDRNETLAETYVTSDQLLFFFESLLPIDVRNMDKASGERSFCSDPEYRIKFWDQDGREYQFMSRYPRKQFAPLIQFITSLPKG